MPRYTIFEVAKRLNVEREDARGLVRFLVSIGLAQLMGERRPEGGRGSAEKVYVFADNFEQTLCTTLTQARLT